MGTKRTVVIPVDFTEHSKRAFDWYAKRNHEQDELVILAHVLEMPTLSSPSLAQCRIAEDYTMMVQERVDAATKHLQMYEGLCRDIGLKYETRLLASGQSSIGGQIMDLLDEVHATEVIVGSRGLSKMRRTTLGSMSQYVLHHSRIPVTVVPPEEQFNPF